MFLPRAQQVTAGSKVKRLQRVLHTGSQVLNPISSERDIALTFTLLPSGFSLHNSRNRNGDKTKCVHEFFVTLNVALQFTSSLFGGEGAHILYGHTNTYVCCVHVILVPH